MQKLWITAIFFVGLFSACDNDLNLTAGWKDIPVIYGVLSPADTAHYIRIEKAFLDPSKSALELARIPDSLYYDEIEAVLVNTATGQRVVLEEVDGANEGYPREDGVFAESPNILYKATAAEANLTPGHRMRLEVTRSEQLPIVTAETTIVGRPTINRPQDNDELNILPNNTYRFSWSEAVGAAFYDVILYFHYNEFHIDNPLDIQSKEVVWKVSGVITANELEVPGLEFYQFLRATIPVNSQLRRTFEGMDVQVRAGGQELYEFQRVQLANSGITSAGGDIPQYTNLSEGVGIFSSANRHTRGDLDLRPQALDSLKEGSITEPLNFIQ